MIPESNRELVYWSQLLKGNYAKGANNLRAIMAVPQTAQDFIAAGYGLITVYQTEDRSTQALVDVIEDAGYGERAMTRWLNLVNGWNFSTWADLAADPTAMQVIADNPLFSRRTLPRFETYGVEWDSSLTATTLTRIGRAAGLSSPTPAVGAGGGSSPFDSIAPWSEVDEFNVVSNAVSHRRGSGSFSRTANDTVVRVPKFWYRIERDGPRMRFHVSPAPFPGGEVHPAFDRGDGVVRDAIYIGRYHTGASYVSKSGLAPLVSITRSAARSGSAGKASKWWQWDYAAWGALWLLYLVEYADWDSQSAVGRGYVDGNSSALASGQTDSMTYHTGRAAGTDGKTAVQYRGVENPWGNIRQWVDGVNFNERRAYVRLNPSGFADDTASGYVDTGVSLPSSGYISGLALSGAAPWAFLPSAAAGSDNTYIPDQVYSNTGWRGLCVGGNRSNASYAGLGYAGAGNDSAYSSTDLGSRLLFLP